MLSLLQAGVTYGSPSALLRVWSRLLPTPVTKGTDEIIIHIMSKLTDFCEWRFLCVEV